MVKITITALGLMFATEQLGRKWSLIIGGLGQACEYLPTPRSREQRCNADAPILVAMFYIGQWSSQTPVPRQKLPFTRKEL